MPRYSKGNKVLFLLIVGLLAWLVPGAGHFVLGEKKRAIIMFVTIVLTFCTGLYIGSIGVIDLSDTSAIYVKATQVMNPPVAVVLGHYTGGENYPVYGWPNEIGQVYTMTSGLLNLLCIVNAVYLAHLLGSTGSLQGREEMAEG
jgi:hypothetical protein